jgi:hypothetical protein
MAGEGGPIATVAGQEGDHVLLSVRMVGFPAGFRLRAGERVVLVTDDQGHPAVMPLVRSSVQRGVGREAAADNDSIDVAGVQATVQSSTIVNEGDGRDLVVWVVDPGTAEGPPQVIGTRSD